MITFRLATVASTCLIFGGCASVLPSNPRPASSQPVTAQAVGAPSGSTDAAHTLAEVQGLQREIRELRDRIDRQEFELERLQTRQRDLYDDLDQRLRNQERTASATPPSGPSITTAGPVDLPPTASGNAGNTGGLNNTVPTIGAGSGIDQGSAASGGNTAGIDTGSVPTIGGQVVGGAGTGSPATQGGASGASGASSGGAGQVAIVQPRIDAGSASAGGGPVSVSAQEAYDQAFGLLKQSRYADAVAAFEAFIADYPSTDLTDDAYYWLAEARYVTREFEAALNGFRTVTSNFPGSQRVPASYLKIGYIQYEIGAYTDARDTLTYIMKNFPTHRVAVSAETRLKKMDREGR